MKSRLSCMAILTLSSALSGCVERTDETIATSSEAPTAVAFNTAGAPTVDFSVPDMMCPEGCGVAVKRILSELPGAKEVRVDFEAKTATVAIDQNSFDANLAIAELVDKGFGNSQLKSDSPEESPTVTPAIR